MKKIIIKFCIVLIIYFTLFSCSKENPISPIIIEKSILGDWQWYFTAYLGTSRYIDRTTAGYTQSYSFLSDSTFVEYIDLKVSSKGYFRIRYDSSSVPGNGKNYIMTLNDGTNIKEYDIQSSMKKDTLALLHRGLLYPDLNLYYRKK